MTNQEAKQILQRDLAIMMKNNSLPDGIEALKIAISALGAIEQFKWERDIAIEQLNELGLGLGQKTDDVQMAINLSKSIHKTIPIIKEEANKIGNQACEDFQQMKNEVPYHRDLFHSIQMQGFAHGMLYALKKLGVSKWD